MKKLLSIALILCLMLGLGGCFFDESDVYDSSDREDEQEESLIDPETGTIYPDKWYTTEILAGVEFYNCGITDAFPRQSGGIFATYVPVCRNCHEEGWSGTATFSTEQPYETTWSCDCGTRTSVLIRYNP